VSLLLDLLAAQQEPTAVDRFAALVDEPTDEHWYRHLLPAAPPGPGQQYAFEVDLDTCTSCKACVTACHSLNGLDPGESFRSVGLVVGTDAAYQQTVTTGCHHCADPACMKGCPVKAYEKDRATGIVRHLDDQCIGCRYCTLMCPYEVPQYNDRLGIVRKCDLCADRLAEGEAPACVQGCPTESIRITLVDTGATVDWPLPDVPAKELTRPSTVFRTARAVPAGARAVDAGWFVPAHAHAPLAVMLVLTQLAVAAFAVGADPLVALLAGVVALGASVLHLGRPLQAWRALLGVRTSWISREIAAFSLFAGLAALEASWSFTGDPPAALRPAVVAAGVVGILCSVAVYAATGRRWWGFGTLLVRFTLTAAVGGLCVLLLTEPGAAGATAAAVAVKLVVDAAVLRHHRDGTATELGRTAGLLIGELRGRARQRAALAASAIALSLLLLAPMPAPLAVAVAAAVLVTAMTGELLERWLLFTASAPARMPGGLA
jgi:formate dehydrogenase iron-sulfur subunit